MLQPQVTDLFSRLASVGPSTQRAYKRWLADPDWDPITRAFDSSEALDAGFDYGFIFGIANVMGLTVVDLLQQTGYLR